jgi:predicted metalloprotease with PDZ domain
MEIENTELRKAWDRFESLANWSLLHPLDEDRFNQFLVIAYRQGQEMSQQLISHYYKGAQNTEMWDRLVRETENAKGLLDVAFERGRRA